MSDSSLMAFRTMAQMLKIAVMPEITHRFSTGKLTKPFHLKCFRFSQRILDGGSVEPIVELNDEVQLIMQVKAKRPIQAGQDVTLKDFYPDECFIRPPESDGKPLSYFLCQAAFLNFFNFFDFSPNIPEFVASENTPRLQYPILDFINAKKLHDEINPIRQIQFLSDSNWPPAPGYYPTVLVELYRNPAQINNPGFVETVSSAYNRAYWDEHLAFWKETDFFPGRLVYLQKAVDEFFSDDFIATIYVLVPQFEGIVKDYIRATSGRTFSKFETAVRHLKNTLVSRGVFMFPPVFLDIIFDFLEKGSFWKGTARINPSDQVNRHGIAHGVFTGFESKGIALKYLVLMDSLAFILLHDRLLTGNL